MFRRCLGVCLNERTANVECTMECCTEVSRVSVGAEGLEPARCRGVKMFHFEVTAVFPLCV